MLGGRGWPRLSGVLKEDSELGTIKGALWGKSKGSKQRRGFEEEEREQGT